MVTSPFVVDLCESALEANSPKLDGSAGFVKEACGAQQKRHASHFETLQERAELFFTESGITDDAAHRERVARLTG
jgi:hypothetical protein